MSIQAIEPVALAAASAAPATTAAPQATGFADMLAAGVGKTDASIQSAEQQLAAFAAGENIPPHQVMLALEDARMSFQFALQVRSRLVEGVQELMRMQL
jgi:flagellar hook-basal body complex protein FliE